MKTKLKALAPMALLILFSSCKISGGGSAEMSPTDTTVIAAPITDHALPPVVAAAPSPALTGLDSIASNFDLSKELAPAWGTGAIPPAGHTVGAFRFICNAGKLLRDDPIVFPGQAGRSHLHQFYGNTAVDASSTYESLRTTGESTCMSPVNRSAYWMPAMLDGKGNAVRPDYISIYYKRRPASDPKCSLTGDSQPEGNCVPLPNGLRFVYGFDMVSGKAPTGGYYFNCDGPTGKQGIYKTIAMAAANCPIGAGNRLGAIIHAPACWDGKNLDSPNHRDHVAYMNADRGYLRCPDSHPFVIPEFTMQAWYTVDENIGTWRFSSDESHPDLPAGTTFHADWFGAWDNTVMSMWTDHCIDRLLDCAGGDLGNGKAMMQSAAFAWKAEPRLVRIVN